MESAEEIIKKPPQDEVVGIDEAQFFDDTLINVCKKLADQKKRVIVAGLDKDYRGEPFGPMPGLLSEAEYITKTLAICVVCGNPANYTQRLNQETDRIVVGEKDKYEARCRKCYESPEE